MGLHGLGKGTRGSDIISGQLRGGKGKGGPFGVFGLVPAERKGRLRGFRGPDKDGCGVWVPGGRDDVGGA